MEQWVIVYIKYNTFDSREPKKEAMMDIPTDQSDSVKNYFGYEYVKGKMTNVPPKQ